ncbi:hypothetical protein [Luteimonas sp. e5]
MTQHPMSRTSQHLRLPVAMLVLALAACNAPAPGNGNAEEVAPPARASSADDTATANPEPAAPAVPADGAHDWRLPGALTADTTLQQLQARYGTDNVRVVDDLPLAEGDTTRGIVLFPEQPERRATLYFTDTAALAGLASVRVSDPGSLWHFASGVRIGMPLQELVTINAAPVTFYGLSWDYGGRVADWNGGKLDPSAGDIGELGVRLEPAPSAGGDAYPEGDSEYRSDDARWPRLGSALQIGELSYAPPARGAQ